MRIEVEIWDGINPTTALECVKQVIAGGKSLETEKESKKTIEIPFGAKDSELYKFEYTIPEGYEARIEDGKVIVTKKESEDERIRKILIHIVKGACDKYGIKYKGDEITEEKLLAYLEKQKEQKPAEWSEEDKTHLCWIIECFDSWKYQVPEFADQYQSAIDWLKSTRPQPHWKPSEEQMEALMLAIEGKWDAIKPTGYMSRRLEDLYEGLANTFGVECNLEK